MHHEDASSHSILDFPMTNHETDIKNAVQYTRLLLEILGVWSMVSSKSSKVQKCISKILLFSCPILMSFSLLPTIFHMVLREKRPIAKIMLLGPVSSCISSILKYIVIVLRCKTIKLCIEHMENDFMIIVNENERAIMTKNAKIGRSLTILCGVFLYTGGFFYNAIMPILKGSKINELNETIRPIVYPGFDIFLESQKTPIYEIIFFVTCISAFVRYTVTIAACSLAAVFVCHTCGQIEIVKSRLKNLFDGIDENQNSEKLQERMSSIINCHVKGLSLSTKIDEALREICLIEVMAVTLLICLLEYYCMMVPMKIIKRSEWNNSETVAIITYVLLLISYVFNIFILCHIGELLKEQSHQVGKSTYMIEWYRLPGKSGLAIVIIIAMANYPRKLSAGRMMELSLSSFGVIMKTSVMYLNMIRAMAL